MEQILNQILEKLNSLEEGQKVLQSNQENMAGDIKEIKRQVDVIFDRTAHLTEFTTATIDSLNRIEDELSIVQGVTAKNCYDIAKLQLKVAK